MVPQGAWQAWPADGSAPAFEDGKTYRLFTAPDVMIPRQANCTFTYTAPNGG